MILPGVYGRPAFASIEYAVFLDEDPTNIEISEGGRKATRFSNTGDWRNSRGSVYATGGKFYVEMAILSGTANSGGNANYAFSVITDFWQSLWLPGAVQPVAGDSGGTLAAASAASYLSVQGIVYRSGAGAVYGGSDVSPVGIVGIACDTVSGKVWFSYQGAWGGGGNPAAGTGAATVLSGYTKYGVAFASRGVGSEAAVYLNSGQSEFYYPVPTGFNAGLYT